MVNGSYSVIDLDPNIFRCYNVFKFHVPRSVIFCVICILQNAIIIIQVKHCKTSKENVKGNN